MSDIKIRHSVISKVNINGMTITVSISKKGIAYIWRPSKKQKLTLTDRSWNTIEQNFRRFKEAEDRKSIIQKEIELNKKLKSSTPKSEGLDTEGGKQHA